MEEEVVEEGVVGEEVEGTTQERSSFLGLCHLSELLVHVS